eukprot:13925018-Alexandrium_andersonii.AAC.1
MPFLPLAGNSTPIASVESTAKRALMLRMPGRLPYRRMACAGDLSSLSGAMRPTSASTDWRSWSSAFLVASPTLFFLA